MKNSNKTKAIVLSVLWAIASLATYAVSFASEYGESIGVDMPTWINTSFELLIPIVVGCFFIPLLLRIRHYAILSQMSRLEKYSSILGMMFLAALFVSIISLLI